MELLGWMHRKFRQGDTFKEFTGGGTCSCLAGQPSPDEPHHHHLQPYDTFLGLSGDVYSNPSAISAGAGGGDGAVTDLLGGALLSIGTLGLIPQHDDNTSAETPVFGPLLPPAAVAEDTMEAIAEKEADETTESDLMAVSAELERVLAAAAAQEEKDGERRISSARPSGGVTACPLQGFLFGSPVEVREIGREREKRASLGELFMRSRAAEAAAAIAGDEEKGEEEKSTAGIHLMKMLKLGGGSGRSGTVETKLQKILQIFHRKVYPETVTGRTKKTGTKHKKRETTKENYDSAPPIVNGVGTKSKAGGETTLASNNIINNNNNNLRGVCKKESMPTFYSCSNRSSVGLDQTGGSSANKGHWIKTDADYLVLEL